jgi:hypothetical protein
LPRLLHPPGRLSARSRVAPRPRPLTSPATNPASRPAFFALSRAGNRSSSCPESQCFSDAGFVTRRVTPLRYAPVRIASDVGLGLPLVLHLRLAGDGSSSCLESRILRRCRLADLRVAPSFGSSVSPMIRSPSRLGSRIFRPRLVISPVSQGIAPSGLPWSNLRVAPNLLPLARRRANFKVALNLRSFDVASGSICRLPRISFLRRCRRRFSDFSESASTAGSMMNPRLVLELCILDLRRG